MVDPHGRIRVEVVYAEPHRTWSRQVTLAAGACAAEAVACSGLATERPDVQVTADGLGVFGRRVQPGHRLHDGDRVEVYRPLRLDPMEARRRRARSRG